MHAIVDLPSNAAPLRTILIVDDNAEFRLSAQWWLASAGYEVVNYADPVAALASLSNCPPAGPACLMLDVRMPGMSGLELHDRLREQGVDLPVVYMSGHGDVPLAVQAMQKGAVSFLEKPFVEAELEAVLSRVFSAPRIAKDQAAPTRRSAKSRTPAAQRQPDDGEVAWQLRLDTLTPREREVFQGVVDGQLNKVLAHHMGVSVKTVELHRQRGMAKLGATSATHLVRMAVSGRVV